MGWYETMARTIHEMRGGLDMLTACRIFAACSINQTVKGNVTLARRNMHRVRPVGLPQTRDGIRRARKGLDLNGRKVSAFARALAGDTDAVVIDRWMARAYDVSLPRTATAYARLSARIAADAHAAGMTPRDYQAHVWVRERGAAW